VNRKHLYQSKRSTLFQVDDRVQLARKGDDDDRRRSDIEGRSGDEPFGCRNGLELTSSRTASGVGRVTSKVFPEAVEGFTHDLIPAGSVLAYPAVTSKLSQSRRIAEKEAVFLRRHITFRTIVALPSAYTIGRRMWKSGTLTSAYPTREELMEACIPIIRDEIEALVAKGVDMIQIDEPWLEVLVDPAYRR